MNLTANVVLESLGVFEQGFDLGKDALAHFGQFYAAAGAGEQSVLAFALKGVELAAEQGLIAVKKLRCTRQATEFGNRQKQPPLLQVSRDVDL
jgi:hypothetical protein